MRPPDSEVSALRNRFSELAARSESRSSWVFSDFLGLAEQNELSLLRLSSPYILCGGFSAAERKLACFGSEEICGYTEPPPIACVRLSPLNQKFADDLTHRDFLGSLMALGIKRETLGDIVVRENLGCVFCLDSVADFVCAELRQVKRTSVRAEILESAPDFAIEPPPMSRINAASERLDGLVAAVWNLSRSDAQELFAKELVFVNGVCALKPAASPAPGDIVSVRGLGRFLYEGVEGETRRGRLRASVRIY